MLRATLRIDFRLEEPQLLTLVEGQISFGGMHDVMEAVSRHKNVTNGVLRITSNHASGMVGVFCGRYLTGAVLVLSGESGYGALKTLLAAKDGTFAFMDALGEHLPDLRQSLGVDISMLLASPGFADADLPISEESLTGMKPSGDEVLLIDTSINLHEEPAEDTESSRLERISKTYDRLLSLAEYRKAQEQEQAPGLSSIQQSEHWPSSSGPAASTKGEPKSPTGPAPSVAPTEAGQWPAETYGHNRESHQSTVFDDQSTVDIEEATREQEGYIAMRRSPPVEVGDVNPMAPAELRGPQIDGNEAAESVPASASASGTRASAPSQQQFSRLKHWNTSDKGAKLALGIMVVLLVVAYLVTTYGPHLLKH